MWSRLLYVVRIQAQTHLTDYVLTSENTEK